MTEKTGNRTNRTGGANKFQKRHKNKRSNGEDTGYQKKGGEDGHPTPKVRNTERSWRKFFEKLTHQAIIRQEEY